MSKLRKVQGGFVSSDHYPKAGTPIWEEDAKRFERTLMSVCKLAGNASYKESREALLTRLRDVFLLAGNALDET